MPPAEQEARLALDAYPLLCAAGVSYTCLEEREGRWLILACGAGTPQEAREALACRFRLRASAGGEPESIEEYRAAAELLDCERHDQLNVAGRRFRIGRIEGYSRMNADGPEPPRPSDERPVVVDDTDVATRMSRPVGFLDDLALSGTAAAVTRYELHNKIPEPAGRDDRQDSAQALTTYSQIVLIAAVFGVAREKDGAWQGFPGETCDTPQEARHGLVDHFRHVIPGPASPHPALAQAATQLGWQTPPPDVLREYAAAADLLDASGCNEVSADKQRFRITRLGRLVRIGTDGPEPPRPSDPDPYPPPAAEG